MKIKYSYLLILLFTIFALTLTLFRGDGELSNQSPTVQFQQELITRPSLKKAIINNDTKSLMTDSEFDDEPLFLPGSEDEDEQQEVIEVGEYIDVDAESMFLDDAEDTETDIGEFIDVDAETTPQNNTKEPGEVIDIGEFIDVDKEPMLQDDAESSETVINIGEFVEVDLE